MLFAIAEIKPAHIKLSVESKKSCPLSAFLFRSFLKNRYDMMTVEIWHRQNKIPVFAKIASSRLEQNAQIKPGTRPHKAVTAIVSTESR